MLDSLKPHRHTGKFYRTGWSPRALWQRWRLWRAYRRTVTWGDLRRVAYNCQQNGEDPNQPDPAAEKLFDAIIREAERPVFGR